MKTFNLIVTLILLSSFTSANELDSFDKYLAVTPKVCQIPSGQSNCSVKITFGKNDGQKQCLFYKNTKKKVSCSSGISHLTIRWINKNKATFEVRSGSDYNRSQSLASIDVVGVKVDESLQEVITTNHRENHLVNGGENKHGGHSTSSWDGRLIFGAKRFSNQKYGMMVRVFRPESLDGKDPKDVNLNDKNLYSDPHIIDSAPMTNAEIQTELSHSNNNGLVGMQNIGKGLLKSKIGFHLAIYPHGSINANPYPSNSTGNFSLNGGYQTYRFYGILPTTKVTNPNGTITESSYPLNNSSSNTEKKHFLSKFQMQVVVRHPHTQYAEIYSSKVITQATPLRDKNNNLIHGYEPSATLDGRLILYSANYKPSVNEGNGGTVGYTYHQNQHLTTGYSVPRNLAEMYELDGAGARSETILANEKFSDLFPIAKKPIREFDGTVFTKSDLISGAYPWVSFEGTEVVFSSKSGFHGASRHGTTVVGEKTKWILQRIDGGMEATRGNVQDKFGLFDGPAEDNPENAELSNAYNNTIYPNTKSAFGKNGWKSILIIPVLQSSSSWSAFSELAESPFPLNHSFRDSYGFFLKGNRYGEVKFPNLRDNLLLYYPMQEAYKYNKSIVNLKKDNTPSTSSDKDNMRKNGLLYQEKDIADYSGLFHTASMNSQAYYPYNYYNAPKKWAEQKLIFDRAEGFYGNSIVFKKAGVAQSRLSSQAIQKIRSSQSFSLSFWFKKNRNGPIPLMKIDSLFKISGNDNKIEGTVYTSKTESTNSFSIANTLQNNQWINIQLNYSAGLMKVFINAEEILSKRLKGKILNSNPNNLSIELGPNNLGSVNGGQRLWLDEVHLYDLSLPLDEIYTLAHKKHSIKINLNAQKVELGRKLFEETELSQNNTVSCMTCHKADRGFADNNQFTTTSFGTTSRNTPTIIGSAKQMHQHMDGNVSGIMAQSIQPILNKSEMGSRDLNTIITKINNKYRNEFVAAFGKSANISLIAQSLGHFVASLDANGVKERSPTSSTIARGKQLFNGKANCIACHSGDNFTDGRFHDLGSFRDSDLGRGLVTWSPNLIGSFKTPSLINISKTAPYFHDGRFDSLDAVVEFYNNGGDGEHIGRSVNSSIKPLGLSSNDKNDLVNYLKSLNQ